MFEGQGGADIVAVAFGEFCPFCFALKIVFEGAIVGDRFINGV